MTDFLVVGLGNPGAAYRQTRHNFGFLVLDKLASEMAITCRELTAPAAMVGVGEYEGKTVCLAKPLTYMNLSGRAVAALVKFFRIEAPEQVIVIHDDLDLPFGTVRIKRGGGHGGHNGLRSVIDCLGTNEFLRVRMGIGLEAKPADVVEHVLSPFSAEEQTRLAEIIDRGREAVRMIITVGCERAMNFCNRTL
ncbi:MAG: aminoacyl-tRNA hydrolase [Deltaproteobacteria bacterium]|nr:aminoacyl-tRNA hydrolase [Deltaproteobacteria bacterium]